MFDSCMMRSINDAGDDGETEVGMLREYIWWKKEYEEEYETEIRRFFRFRERKMERSMEIREDMKVAGESGRVRTPGEVKVRR